MPDLETFRQRNSRAWLEANAPKGVHQGSPCCSELEGSWGGRKARPMRIPDMKVWLDVMAAEGLDSRPAGPSEYGGGGLDDEEAKDSR